MNDIISIIIPIYNGEKNIKKCLDSILNQTYVNIEIILINDGSNDSTLQIIKKYSKKDKRIIIIDKKNTGVSDSRNCGIDKAKGKYLMFIDSDDWIEYDMIRNMYNVAVEEDAEWVKCGYYIDDINGITMYPELFKERGLIDNKNELMKIAINSYYLNQVWAQLIKTDIIKKNNIRFDKNLLYAEDYDFNIELIKYTNKFIYLPERYYHYFQNLSGTVRGITCIEKLIDEMRACVIVYNKLKDLDIREEYNEIIEKKIKEEILIIIKRSYKKKNNIKFSEKIELLKQTRNMLINQKIEKKNMGILKFIYNRQFVLFTIVYLNYYKFRQFIKKILNNKKVK